MKPGSQRPRRSARLPFLTRALVSFFVVFCLWQAPPTFAGQPSVTVFAAASFKTALDELAEAYTAQTGVPIIRAYAATSTLARQIEAGAPAEIFVSANAAWMDHLANRGRLAPNSRRDIAGNRLVLVAPNASQGDEDPVARQIPLADGSAILTTLGDGRLAMAFVEAVPAGIYGKAALVSLGIWERVASRVAEVDNVRAALALVALGAVPLGIVYETDARADPRVRLIGRFPDASHPPIRYPAALLAPGPTPQARAFLGYLSGAKAQAVLARNGFRPPPG
ncbi:MAG: molybdate ABC transporter substrate-binding protein [Pikeienuella sp.]